MSLHNERIADIALHEKEEKKHEIEIVAHMGANIPWKPMI